MNSSWEDTGQIPSELAALNEMLSATAASIGQSFDEVAATKSGPPPETCYFRASTENYVITFSFLIIFLLSVLGNALVLIVILTQRAMRSITNLYLMNLAISDLMLSVICMPSTLISTIMNCWMFGPIMCKLLAYLQPVVVTASAYTLAVIAIERYYAICRPLHSRIWQTRSHAYCMISLVWLIAIAANVLCLFMYEEKSYNITGLVCAPIHEPWKHFAYQVYMTVVLLLVPLVLMTALYGQVISSLRIGIRMDIAATENSVVDNDNSVEDSDSGRKASLQKLNLKLNNNNVGSSSRARTATISSTPRREMMQSVRSTHTQKSAAAKQRVVRMLIVIVIIFFCCWTPSYIWWLMLLAGDSFPGVINVWNSDLNSFITVLTYLSSCTNPITYCFLNKKFRTAMLTTFGRKTLIRTHFQKVYLPTAKANFFPQNGQMHRSMSSNYNQAPPCQQLDKNVLRRANSNEIAWEATDTKTRLLNNELDGVGRETHC